jgi:hypothetical protein
MGQEVTYKPISPGKPGPSRSKKAEKIIKDVNATMALEGMPLTSFDIELISKVADGEITREEAFKLFNASIGING